MRALQKEATNAADTQKIQPFSILLPSTGSLLSKTAGTTLTSTTNTKQKRTSLPVLFGITLTLFEFTAAVAGDDRRLQQLPLFFREEPPSSVVFLNSTGAVIPCDGGGVSKPRAVWTRPDGAPLSPIPGLRQFRSDGSMVLQPFSGEQFRTEVHSGLFRCQLTSDAGSIGSRDVRVTAASVERTDKKQEELDGEGDKDSSGSSPSSSRRPLTRQAAHCLVLKMPIEVSVTDSIANLGGTAILRCLIHPPAMRQMANITGWSTDDDMTIVPSNAKSFSTPRYQAFLNGLLLISGVTRADERRRFRCVVENSITGEKMESQAWGKVIVTEPKGYSPPRIFESELREKIQEDATLRLPCVASGHPAPTYNWYRVMSQSGQKIPLNTHWNTGGTLVLTRVTLSDSGKYVCVANNTMGQDRAERDVVVTAALKAEILPRRLTVRSGDDVTVNCTYRGGPVREVRWLKDNKPLQNDHRVRLLGRLVLHISSFRRADTGMYQCFVNNEQDSAQGHAYLRIEEIHPTIREKFIGGKFKPRSEISLKCQATGSPLPQLSWLLDGSPLPETRDINQGDFVQPDGALVVSFVNVTSMKVEYGGDYTCMATNDVGTAMHTQRINVEGDPYIRPMKDITVVAGKELNIKCPAAGDVASMFIKKDNRQISREPRYGLAEDRSSLSIHEARKDDAGLYTCIAKGYGTKNASRSVMVTVVSAPQISPILFSDKIHEGMRAMASCNIIDGDPPMRVSWWRNGQPLRDGQDQNNVQLSNPSEYSSFLTINNVTRAYTGNYTCVANNNAAVSNYTAMLLVKAPPRWKIAPRDMSAIMSTSITFDCQAEGEPDPVVRWKYAKDEASDFHGIVSSPHMHVLENGSLNIISVQTEDKGRYLCEAANGVGPSLSAAVDLIVHRGPHITGLAKSMHVRSTAETSLPCTVSGDEPLSIIWSKDGILVPLHDERYVITEEKSFYGKKSILRLRAAERSDTATFSCTATNPYGKAAEGLRLIVQGAPDPPDDIVFSDVRSTSVVAKWNIPYSGNSDISSYTINYHPVSEPEATRVITVPGTSADATLQELIPATQYQFVIKASNALGDSIFSKPTLVKTKMDAPKTPPSHVTASAVDSRTIRVTWRKPAERARNSHLSGYYVGYKEADATEQLVYKTVDIDHSTQPASSREEYTITGLKKNTKYTVVVQAFNPQGSGPLSNELIVKTYEYDPPPSPPLKIIATTSSSIHVRWEQDLNKYKVTGYLLHYKHLGAEWKEMQLHSFTTNKIVEGLLCGTTYQIFLTAFNDIGRGEPSPVIEVATEGRAPIAPLSDAFISSNQTTATLNIATWGDGGCPIRHFVVQYKLAQHRDWLLLSSDLLKEKQQVLVVGELQPSSWYELLVTAHNEAGFTEEDYQFATLTPSGGTIPPPLAGTRQVSMLRDPAVLVPVLCAATVVILLISAVSLLFMRNRRGHPHGHSNDICQSREDLSMNTYGKCSKDPVNDIMYNNDHETLYCPYAAQQAAEAFNFKGDMVAETLRRVAKNKEHTYEVPHRIRAVQQGYCNGVSSSATLDRTAMGQTPKQKYRPLSLGRSFDQDLFEEDLEDMYKEAAANQHKQEAVSSIISSGAAESDLCSSAYEDDSIIIGDACPQSDCRYNYSTSTLKAHQQIPHIQQASHPQQGQPPPGSQSPYAQPRPISDKWSVKL
ncbi:Down syndrome cell adhesion molecule-like protein 1 homolog isoform X3 [Varroa destructor]|uniref:Down syndrome cell adhesion molecule-like protein Dscam2 n=1 Tax=Varroa destructor TaxID=109461 RepID=A0A7M7K4U7_VARDE|nr:Down syndrome cell adhesion molecule-like protein 1 homolog isoform X3 [Varroa destructor]